MSKLKFFRHKSTKLVIQISDEIVEGKQVTFTRQGGGLCYQISAAALQAEYDPYQMPAYSLCEVSIDSFPEGVSVPAYLNGERWNGFAIPYFPKASLATILEHCPEVSFDEAADRCVISHADFDDEEADEVVEPTAVLTVDGQTVTTYPVGAASWVWWVVGDKDGS